MHWGRLITKTIKWIVLSFAILSALFVSGCWLLMELAFPPHDTDDILIQNFVDNQQVFEEIVAKVLRDGDVKRVGHNWYELTDGISREDNPKRIAEYRKLFKKISIDDGIQVNYSSTGEVRVLFYSSCIGFLSPGSCKGYAYEPYPRDASILVDSIDDFEPKATRSAYWWIQRKIEGKDNWYLYFDSDELK